MSVTARRLALVFACALGASCSAATTPPPRADEPPIASVWRARCGACHAPVQPGTHGESSLRAAARRHEKRVHLTAAEWDALIGWLSG